DLGRGRLLAGGIAALNVVVLLTVVVRRATGGAVASETLAAMTLRAVVWLALTAVLTVALRAAVDRPSAERHGYSPRDVGRYPTDERRRASHLALRDRDPGSRLPGGRSSEATPSVAYRPVPDPRSQVTSSNPRTQEHRDERLR